MRKTAVFYMINFIYMEFIFHLYFWKDVKVSWFPALGLILVLSFLQAFLQSLFKSRGQKVFLGVFLGGDYLLFASQLVYRSIFKQPLLIDAIIYGSGDALSNFWREALLGILNTALGLLALSLGIVWIIIVLKLMQKDRREPGYKCTAVYIGCLAGSIAVLYGALFGMQQVVPEQYEEYQEYGSPDDILEHFGVTSLWVRDADVLYLPEAEELMAGVVLESAKENCETYWGSECSAVQETAVSTERETSTSSDESDIAVIYPETKYHTLNTDFAYLKEIGSDAVDKVTDYLLSIPPTKENAYTGIFEGYNLIFLTAEGFSPAVVNEQLTPTLYKLVHSGVVAENYYVPLWQTSTSDGEYANLMGLFPDQQFSMKRSAENAQPYSLASYFKAEGAVCYAYHNNSLTYYDRHLSHPNLGYIFKASKLGNAGEEEWGQNLFHMEHPNYWPASDLEMMQATLPDYIQEERFHVYYLTVSGHMNYNFLGNRMSGLHKEEVRGLPYSEEGKAYIACNIELDRALAYLISELEAAGRLEKTVICLSADHYPYGMNQTNYEEIIGQDLDNSLEIYRNSLILWNSEMGTVTVQKPCSSVDLMPTLLNLFGFEYDSRLFSGRDIFSEQEGLVVFANRSFITDQVSYNRKTGEVISRNGQSVNEAYVENVKSYVKLLYKHSAGILNNNYYNYYQQAVK